VEGAKAQWKSVLLLTLLIRQSTIMYKLLNLLFGWDYIAWYNPADSGIARVHVDGMHRVWYWRYKTTRVADIIKAPERVIWLTCPSTKYFPPSVPQKSTYNQP
jgi:hypothetical protein